jgi:hypothetical protein
MQKTIKRLLILPWIIVLAPMLLYQFQVNRLDGQWLSFTHNSETWGHFGDFMNVWVSMASLIVLTGLTYYIHKIEILREEERERAEANRQENIKRDEILKNRPALIFDEYEGGLWKVKNVGLQVALNIYMTKIEPMFEEQEKPKGFFMNYSVILGYKIMDGVARKLGALTANEGRILEWSKQSIMLFALYEDIYGNEILSLTNNHETKVITESDEKNELRKQYKAIQELYYWKEDSNISWKENNHPLGPVSKR